MIEAISGEKDADAIAPGRFRMHHIGLAVAELEGPTKFLVDFFGYRVTSGPFADPLQRVWVLFLAGPGDSGDKAELELVAPLTDDSPLQTILRKNGGGTYHSCLEVDDLDGALQAARAQDCVVVSEAMPAVAFGGRRIAWIYTPAFQLFELLETTVR